MRRLLRLAHLLSGAVLIGALASSLLISATADQIAPAEFAAVRGALALIGNALLLPALLSTLLFGALLLVGHPTLIGARWVWAKAVLGASATAIAVFVVMPAVNRAAALARGGIEMPSFAALQAALSSDLTGEVILLVLVVTAAALGVMRPSFGASRRQD